MIACYVERDYEDGGDVFYVMKMTQGSKRSTTESGPWRTAAIAWAQAETLAHRAGAPAQYTFLPDDLQRIRAASRDGGSRAAWVVP